MNTLDQKTQRLRDDAQLTRQRIRDVENMILRAEGEGLPVQSLRVELDRSKAKLAALERVIQ